MGAVHLPQHGDTALIWSCGLGHSDIAKWLVRTQKVDPHVMNKVMYRMHPLSFMLVTLYTGHQVGDTALNLACRHGHLGLVKWLVEECGADPGHANTQVWRSFQQAGDQQRPLYCDM